MLCCAVSCHAVPCCAMPCFAMLCFAMPYHAVLCHAMLCFAMPCCAVRTKYMPAATGSDSVRRALKLLGHCPADLPLAGLRRTQGTASPANAAPERISHTANRASDPLQEAQGCFRLDKKMQFSSFAAGLDVPLRSCCMITRNCLAAE